MKLESPMTQATGPGNIIRMCRDDLLPRHGPNRSILCDGKQRARLRSLDNDGRGLSTNGYARSGGNVRSLEGMLEGCCPELGRNECKRLFSRKQGS